MPRYPDPGTVLLGKYRVDSLIGEGGMGAVVKAKHLDLDEMVAIKILLPDMLDRNELVQRFLREAKAAVKLKGEHVARVLDVGRLDGLFKGVPYIVMEYLDGADLNAIVKHHGAQEPEVAVDLLLQACEAIAEAHSINIIHRDIKASNFFITQPDGESPHLKVLDFGIATAPQGVSELTDAESVIGTPAYMAPEQMRAARVADQRSDIWSMGVVLYELLEGARPFRSEVYSDLCLKVGMDPPEPMANPKVPEALRAIVLKCLEKPVERRYQSIAELAFDLMPFASDPVIARASVEQCARLLGRRSTKALEAVGAYDGATTPDGVPMRITPTASRAAVTPDKTPSGEGLGAIARKLTPVPGMPAQRTPTSINAGSGEVAGLPPAPASRRRAPVIAGAAIVVLAAAAAGMYFFVGVGHDAEDNTPSVAPAAAPPPAPATVEMPAAPAPEPVKPAAVPVASPDPPAPERTPVAVPPPTVKKKLVVHPHPIVKKKKEPVVDDPFNKRQ